ncbi:MAG TPA: hypothetical protein VFO77_15640 [Actinoplanes sp.]|nr:hypothetical protein [Actinoplanes sp.]
MFRLVQLHADGGIARIGVDHDGYANERAALTGLRAAPATFFGVGRFDDTNTLIEVIVDSVCGPIGDCPRTATVVHAETYQRLCADCAFGLTVLSLDELAARLGVAVRHAQVFADTGRHAAAGDVHALSNRIAREFATHVADPVWRTDVCSELAGTPEAVNGLLIGVGALSHRDVLDLFPALRSLAAQLPMRIQADLLRASPRPLSPAGMAALRLGL